MKANVKALSENLNANHRKSDLHRALFVIDPATGQKIVDCRIYWPKQRAYACVWIYGEKARGAGSAWAGGGGYCKQSAAIASALDMAGVELSDNVAGRGLDACKVALVAVAKAASGLRKVQLVEAYA